MRPISLNSEPFRPLTVQEESLVPDPSQKWSADRAKSIAVQNHEKAETFQRTSGHTRRWTTAEELYLGWRPQKTWEGTRIPRASMPVYLINEQVESILPSVLGALFPLRDNLEVAPRPGTNMAEARAAFELLMYQFQSLGESGMTNLREVARRAFKNGFLYGNGPIEVCWLNKVTEVLRYYGMDVPVRRNMRDPITNLIHSIPTGEFKRIIQEQKVKQYLSQPDIRALNIRDFFIDPNCASPLVSDARYASARTLMTIGELKSYRGTAGWDIPSDSSLVELARAKEGQTVDQQKQNVEVYRNGGWMPQNDYSANPDQWRIEVLRYYEPERCVWILNRRHVAYNAGNACGFIPFLDAFYIDVPGRFYGLAISDVLEGEQRTQQSIIEARLDELALNIHAPFLKKRGISIAQSALRIAPGRIIEVGDNPKEDLVKLDYKPVTGEAYMEVEASDKRAQKITGLTDLAALGTSSAGGNSANRTATGVNTQVAATGKRLNYQVENAETTFIEPLCNMVHQMNQRFLPRDKVIEILGPEGEALQFDPLNVLNANVKFSMRASDKMRSRAMLSQALPFLLQYITNPAFLQMMAQQQGKTLDLGELLYLISDTLQISPKQLFRDMSQQEQAMNNQQQQQDIAAKMQMQQMRLQAQSEMQSDKEDTSLMNTAMGKMITPEAGASLLDSMGLDGPKKLMLEKKKPVAKPAAKR